MVTVIKWQVIDVKVVPATDSPLEAHDMGTGPCVQQLTRMSGTVAVVSC